MKKILFALMAFVLVSFVTASDYSIKDIYKRHRN